MDWEKIFANNETDKGLISKIHKQLIQFNKKKQTIDEVKFEVLQKAMVMNSEVSMTALTKFKGYYIYYINSCERNVVMIYNDGLSLSQLKKNIDDNKSQLFEYIYMI